MDSSECGMRPNDRMLHEGGSPGGGEGWSRCSDSRITMSRVPKSTRADVDARLHLFIVSTAVDPMGQPLLCVLALTALLLPEVASVPMNQRRKVR